MWYIVVWLRYITGVACVDSTDPFRFRKDLPNQLTLIRKICPLVIEDRTTPARIRYLACIAYAKVQEDQEFSSISMSYTLTYQLSPERTRGLHGSPMNRPQAVNWANRTAAASPRSLRCAAIRAAPIASGTFPLHALRFGLQAPVSAQRRRVRKVPPQAVRNLPHQKMSIHHATTLNVRDASRLSVIGVYMPFARSDIMLPPPTGALRSRGGYRRPAEALHTGYDLREPRKTSRVVDCWQ